MSPFDNYQNDLLVNDPTYNYLVNSITKMKEQGVHESDKQFITTLQILKYYIIRLSNAAAGKPVANGTAGSGQEMDIFKGQIEALKYLSRDLPVPAEVLSSMNPLILNDPNIKEPEVTALRFFQKGVLQYDPTAQQNGVGGLQQQYLQQQQAAGTVSAGPQVSIIPVTLPNGTVENVKNLSEAYLSIDQREEHISNRIRARNADLKDLPSVLPSELKQSAMIEMKEIKLLELQRSIRIDITAENNETIFLTGSSEVDLFIKPIPRLSNSVKPMDLMFDKQSSHLPDSVWETSRKKVLSAIFHHHKEFKLYHDKVERERKVMNSQLSKYFKEREKREQERLKKIRIKLLRDRDTEGYRELLNQTKNERLSMLMSQTDELLGTIDQLVQKEEKDKKERDVVVDKDKVPEKDKTEDKAQPVPSTPTANGPVVNSVKSPISSTTTLIQKKNMSDEVVTVQPDVMSGGVLKPYQLTGLEWLVSLYKRDLNGILADEMGLGKTVQTIALVCYLYEKLNVREPFLIVAPLSTISNWASEIIRWAPKLSNQAIIYKGKPEERKELSRKIPKHGFGIVVTSFEYIILDKKNLMKVPWCYVIVDEGHRIKNKQSKLAVQLRQYHSKHRLLLTGTPLQNDLSELWSLLNFLLPKIFDSQDTFENWFNAPFATKGTKNLIAVNEEESLIIINRLHQVLRYFLLRRLKSDVESQLPSKSEIVIKCNLSAMQIAMYKSLRDRGSLPLDPNSEQYKKSTTKVKGFNNVVKQYQKICNHPYLFRDEWDINEDLVRASGKFDLMDQILQKMHRTEHRVLIFTQMTEVINLMEEYFLLREWDFLRLDGSTKPEERAHLVVQWNRPDSPFWIFVLSTHAGGLGMNLQTADTVIIFDSDWNPQMDLQAQDRCHRIGQTNAVNVYRLISAKSIEETILERATDKLEIDAKIIQAGMFNTHSNDQERRAKLESVLHGFPNSTNDEVPTNLSEINKLIARDDYEFKIFQQMDKDKEAIEAKLAKQTKQPIKPRLMTESELPEWLLHLPELEEDDSATAGKKRQSAVAATNGIVNDDLTEIQFLKMHEKGMSVDEYKQYLKEKKERRERKKRGEQLEEDEVDDSSDDDEEEEEEEEEEESDDSSKRRRKRKTPSKPTRASAKGRKGRGRGRAKSNEDESEDVDVNGTQDESEDQEITDESEINNGTINGTTTTPLKGRRGRKKTKIDPELTSAPENITEEANGHAPDTTIGGANEFDALPAKRTRKPINLSFKLNTKSLNSDNDAHAQQEPNNVNNTPYKPGRRSTSGATPKSTQKGSTKKKDEMIIDVNTTEEEDDSIDSIFEKIWNKMYTSKDRNRKMSTLFLEKPDTLTYPDYYKVIKNPIAMDDIKSKKYSTPEEFLEDWFTMFSNCLSYNDPYSQVYRDAISLYSLLTSELKSQFENIHFKELPIVSESQPEQQSS